MQEAVEVGDLERLQELVKGPKPLQKLEIAAAAYRSLRRCTFSGNTEMACFLYDFIGSAESDRDEAHHITTACELGDLDRIKCIAETAQNQPMRPLCRLVWMPILCGACDGRRPS